MIVYPKYLKAGDIYGRLTIIGVVESSKIKNGKEVVPQLWEYACKCSCGTVTSVKKKYLCRGTKSCGCLQRESISETGKNGKKTNRVEVDGAITRIYFFNTDNYTIIDTVDYPLVCDFCWHETVQGYANTTSTHKKDITISRLLLQPDATMDVDHKDHQPLNNRRSNLRECTHAENERNRSLRIDNKSGCSGVHYRKDEDRYCVNIGLNGKDISLGRFKDKQDAINARHEAEIKYFKDYAPHICRQKEIICDIFI